MARSSAHKQSTLQFPSVKNAPALGGAGSSKQGASATESKAHAGASKGAATRQAGSSSKGPKAVQHKQLTLTLNSQQEQGQEQEQQAHNVQQEQAAEPQQKRWTMRSATRAAQPPPAPKLPTAAKATAKPVGGKAKASAAANAVKAAKRTNAKGKQAAGAVQFYDRYEVAGEEFQVGDAVYVIATDDAQELPDDGAEDLCVLCQKGHKSHTIIECERCLAGFHMGCLKPPLKTIPKGSWMCDACTRGEPPGANRALRTTYEKFLFAPKDKPVLNLGLITGFVKNRCGDGEVEFMCRYFCRPEDTHLGRQGHHGSREVFLTNSEYYESVLVIFSSATVCSAKEFEEEEGTDVYMCDYEYDEQWKRFRRRVHNTHKRRGANAEAEESDSADSEFDAAAEAVTSDDEDYVKDRTFKPIYALWAERGMLPGGYRGRAAPPKRGGALNRQAPTITINDEETAPEGGTAVLELVGGGASSVPAPAAYNALVAARKALATAAPPAQLPCRDAEKRQLTSFVQAAIDEEGGSGPGVLYVCGVPGTGKTACIKEVLGNLRPQAVEQGVQLVFLNALSLPSPTHVYCKLWERLTGQRMGPARALAALEAMFAAQQQQAGGPSAGAGSSAAAGGASQGSGHHRAPAGGASASGAAGSSRPAGANGVAGRPKRSCMTLLVVDEIDVLITKDQSVLYNLFEWPVRPGSRLAVIGISNTHDLDDRVLPRISSRLASSKLAFHAYTAEQLERIVAQRLEAAGCQHIIHKTGVVFAVRKVASSSGDVRRALELLRRALEVADAERRQQGKPVLRSASDPAAKDCVTLAHVTTAIKEMFSLPHMQFLRSCSLLEKLCLVALLLELRATSKPDAAVQAVHARLLSHVALLVPEARCEAVAACKALFDMAAKRLLLTSPSWQALKARVALNVHKDDVCQALRDDASLAAVHGQLA